MSVPVCSFVFLDQIRRIGRKQQGGGASVDRGTRDLWELEVVMEKRGDREPLDRWGGAQRCPAHDLADLQSTQVW